MEKMMDEFRKKMIHDGKSERTVEVYSNSVKEFFRWFYESYGNVEYKNCIGRTFWNIKVT